MNQQENLELAPRFLLGEVVVAEQLGPIFIPNQQPTKVWRVLKVGPDFLDFDVKIGDHVVPEKEYPIVLDNKRLSLVHEKVIFGVCPGMHSQAETIKLGPKYILAKPIPVATKTDGGIHIPTAKATPVEMRSSFWTVVKVGPGLQTFADLQPGDQIAPEKHAKVTLDRTEYAMIHEDWILGRLAKNV